MDTEFAFCPTIAYSVRNESYAQHTSYEQLTGHKFRLYSRSHYLDFVEAATIASNDYPGPMRHYGIICEDHIIDVVSVNEPDIEQWTTEHTPQTDDGSRHG